MGRFPQSSESKGSQKWIQKLVNENSEFFDSEIKKNLNLSSTASIRWRSPLKDDKYAEYRDYDAIKCLEINHKVALEDFWPHNGPQWDALGKSDNSNLFLVEAKSHISELISTMQAKNPDSRRRIRRSLKETKQYLGINADVDWSARFYQYTNRLAHLYFLRVKNQLPAYLVFVYFINDTDVQGPTSVSEWKGALSLLRSYLSIGRHILQKYVAELFIDVNDLEE